MAIGRRVTAVGCREEMWQRRQRGGREERARAWASMWCGEPTEVGGDDGGGWRCAGGGDPGRSNRFVMGTAFG